MSAPPSRDDAAGRAYNDLRNKARAAHRPTQELLQLYLLEAFLRRLAGSSHRQNLVLKGGVLLAALGDRRPTKDVDLQARQLSNDADTTTRVILEIARLAADDGVAFDTEAATTEIIREDDGYRAYRVRMPASLATANLRFAVDISVGDPIEPSPQLVQLPCLLTEDTIALVGYPIVMVHAEKLVTALQRGTVNTRWRDFADIWTLSRHWDCGGTELQSALTTVAGYRGAALEAIFPAPPLWPVWLGPPARRPSAMSCAVPRWRWFGRRSSCWACPAREPSSSFSSGCARRSSRPFGLRP